MISGNDNLDPYLEVFDDRGALVGEDDDSGEGRNARLGFNTSSPYIYNVHAKRYGSTAGNYELLLAFKDDKRAQTTRAIPLRQGQRVSGSLDYQDASVEYDFDAGARSVIYIALNVTDGDLDPKLLLYDANRWVTFNDNDGGNRDELVRLTFPNYGGKYRIRATSAGGTGAYELMLNRARSVSVKDQQNLYGSFGGDDSYQVWELDLREGERITIDLESLSGDIDPMLRLSDPNGKQIAADDDGGIGRNARISDKTISRTGAHAVHALSYRAHHSGEFRLRLSLGNTSPPASDKSSDSRLCPLRARLRPGQEAAVTPGQPNRVRNSAGMGGRIIGRIYEGDVVSVLEGPYCVEGYLWYRVRHSSVTGWTAEGGDGEYWLAPYNSPRRSDDDRTTGGTEIAVGGHVLHFDEAARSAMRTAGMEWVKWQVPYHESGDLSVARDRINRSHQAGFRVLLGITGSKHALAAGGDRYLDDYARFLGQVAGLGADAIEVWNEMNLEWEWPRGQIDPRRYATMLQKAYRAIKAANPRTMVITGGLAPTGAESAFGLDRVWNDDRYYRGMANAGLAQYADCIGVHYNEGVLPPTAQSGDPRQHDYPTRYLPSMLRRVAQPFRNYHIPLCITEMGYLSPEGYGRLPENFSWAANTSVREQAQWLAGAIRVAADFRDMPVEMVIVWNIDFGRYDSDPQAGYAIIRPDGSCPACHAIASWRR